MRFFGSLNKKKNAMPVAQKTVIQDLKERIEEFDLYSRFDRYIFQKSCVWLQKSLAEGKRMDCISCNFSRKTLSEPTIAQDLIRIAKRIKKYSSFRTPLPYNTQVYRVLYMIGEHGGKKWFAFYARISLPLMKEFTEIFTKELPQIENAGQIVIYDMKISFVV